jgi:hypothetical protein
MPFDLKIDAKAKSPAFAGLLLIIVKFLPHRINDAG